jgi:hypothetical protein
MKNLTIVFFCLSILTLASCKKKTDPIVSPTSTSTAPRLIFKFKFDSTQARLDAFGQPVAVAAGHGAQSPVFHGMSAHYIELAASDNTALGGGAVLYKAKETTAGGSTAIDFDSSKVVGEGEEFFSIPLKDMAAGSYKWLRVSLAYQNYDIKYKANVAGTDYYFTGRLASFIGFQTYIRTYKINTLSETVNAQKAQGYWSFESLGNIYRGQAPAGATTVPNPIASTSPIPAGSCVVTGQFANNLVITGNETKDIIITVSLSTNKSFEWTESTVDGWYEPANATPEQVTDMGIRGLIPYVQQ